MPLDLSGLTREERVMVQASISNERDFDGVAEALIIQHPRFHFLESQKTSEGQRQRRFQTCRQFKHSLVSRKKQRTNTLAAENPVRVPITRTSLPLKITIIIMKTWMNLQWLIKPTMNQLTLEAMTEKKLWTDHDEENDTFSSHVALDDITVFEAAELVAIVLFAV